jgi:hypothetical protein
LALVKMMSPQLSMISSGAYPKTRSAPIFQLVNVPSGRTV